MAKFNADIEDRIANAINYTKTNLGVKLSVVAYKFVVPYDLFYWRLYGRAASNTRSSYNKALDEIQEGALKAYVNFLIYINAEPNLRTIQQAGNSILRASSSNRILSCNWSKNWFAWNKQ